MPPSRALSRLKSVDFYKKIPRCILLAIAVAHDRITMPVEQSQPGTVVLAQLLQPRIAP
jgi:hypothetical protein